MLGLFFDTIDVCTTRPKQTSARLVQELNVSTVYLYYLGFGSGTNGTALAAMEDVVLVAINYRLGILGNYICFISLLCFAFNYTLIFW